MRFSVDWQSKEGGSAALRLRHPSGLLQNLSLYLWAVRPSNADAEIITRPPAPYVSILLSASCHVRSLFQSIDPSTGSGIFESVALRIDT